VLTGRASCFTVVPARPEGDATGGARRGAAAMLGPGAGFFEAQGVDVEIEVIEDTELGATPPAARRVGADDDHPPPGTPIRSGGPARR
jgi:hypothetical protein